jgi:hypothetical protein
MVPMDVRFISEINRALPPLGYSDRSKFIRDAVYEKLRDMGYEIDREITLAPGRAKPPTGTYPPHRPRAAFLNDKGMPPSSEHERALSKTADVSRAMLKRGYGRKGSSPSSAAHETSARKSEPAPNRRTPRDHPRSTPTEVPESHGGDKGASHHKK